MVVKVVNNTTSLNGLVPTLLVFGVYLRMTKQDPLSLTITKRVEAVCMVIKEIQHLYMEQQI